ncbi:MAG: class I SAM-dependent methyltransferase [Sedimentisphaerales bacterium]|nr:class I SAM-dependent methyltransferase [Sedimentisphaerales bacterium]
MPVQKKKPYWRKRFEMIDNQVDNLYFSSLNDLSQDREFIHVVINGYQQRVRCHDYHRIYTIPGLYEELFYRHLKCCSPSRVVGLLEELMLEFGDDPENLNILDVGAGNGMVGDELHAIHVNKIIGIDIIPEAKKAQLRDRPLIYNDYLVVDLTNLPEMEEEKLRRYHLNALTCVAALGFGDIPPRAFIKALDVIATPSWLAFNIKENFLCEKDSTGFCRLIRQLSQTKVIQIQAFRRYQHRLSITGKPLYYVALVAKKLKDIPDEIMEQ